MAFITYEKGQTLKKRNETVDQTTKEKIMEKGTKALPKDRGHLLMSSLFDEVKVEIQQEDRETVKRIINTRLREIAQAEKILLKLRKQLNELLDQEITNVVSV